MNDYFTKENSLQTNVVFAAILTLVAGFIVIVFIQSALDKIFDYKGNLKWMNEQFKDCFLRNSIALFLPMITLFELASGLMTFGGIIMLWMKKGDILLGGGFALTGVTLLMLLFGQRVSKNYAGAVSLTGYFLIVLVGLFIVGVAG